MLLAVWEFLLTERVIVVIRGGNNAVVLRLIRLEHDSAAAGTPPGAAGDLRQ